MKRQPIPEQRAERVAAIIAERPGADIYAIAEKAGFGVKLTAVALQVARAQGRIGCIYVAQRTAGWFLAEQIEAAQVAAVERKRLTRLAKEKRLRDAKRVPVVKAPKPVPVDPGDVPMIRRRVDTAAPLPFKVNAARSVFELGAA